MLCQSLSSEVLLRLLMLSALKQQTVPNYPRAEPLTFKLPFGLLETFFSYSEMRIPGFFLVFRKIRWAKDSGMTFTYFVCWSGEG